jgi:hypothetical protein
VQTESARKLFDSLEIWDIRPYLLGASGEETDLNQLDSQVLPRRTVLPFTRLPASTSLDVPCAAEVDRNESLRVPAEHKIVWMNVTVNYTQPIVQQSEAMRQAV